MERWKRIRYSFYPLNKVLVLNNNSVCVLLAWLVVVVSLVYRLYLEYVKALKANTKKRIFFIRMRL